MSAGRPGAVWVLFAGIFVAGAALRFLDLERRPLHGDEAVGAHLSRDVRDTGSFRYESVNRHGPFQYYVEGAALALGGESDFSIRFTFALAGSLLPLALLGFRRKLSDPGWLVTCGWIAFSPSFLYYSRYAIQEIDLILSTALLLSAGLAFATSGSAISIITLFLAAAWMVSVKETFIIAWGCLALSLLLGSWIGGRDFREAVRTAMERLRRRRLAATTGAIAGLALVVAAYTDGFRAPAGLGNLARNIAGTIRLGAATPSALMLHYHPPGYFLGLLLRYEWGILLLTTAGLWAALRDRRPLTLFLALDAALMIAVHAALPYKTPWLVLSQLLPLTLLAGCGARDLLEHWHRAGSARNPLLPALLFALLCVPQSLALNFFRPADPAEPLAYHHTGPEQVLLAREIQDLLLRLPRELDPEVLVCLPYYWPLAWYLRDAQAIRFEQSPVPSESPEDLAKIPLVVTLEKADERFLTSFTGSPRFTPAAVPGHRSRPYILIPPDYLVARLWVRSDLAPAGFSD